MNRFKKFGNFRLYFLMIPILLFFYQQLSAGYCITPAAVEETDNCVTDLATTEDCHLLNALLRIAS